MSVVLVGVVVGDGRVNFLIAFLFVLLYCTAYVAPMTTSSRFQLVVDVGRCGFRLPL